jgi:demethylmenaquinone methyltransferase / 2-methoxy-6-polyprenyl-1,4-benzoquinol methylase
MKSINIHNKSAADIESLFSGIARRYDCINHIASMGHDFYWRKDAAKLTPTCRSDKLIDFCCGTGALAFAFAEKDNSPAEIVGCDFSQEMLDFAQKKVSRFVKKKQRQSTTFSWLRCDCTNILLPAESFDIASCAFGLRNIPDWKAAIKEMYRLLKPGGRVCILEFSLPKRPIFRRIYLFYFCHVLPRAAGLLSGRPGAYKHLSESVCRWQSSVDLVKELRSAGFSEIIASPLTISVAVVFTAKK